MFFQGFHVNTWQWEATPQTPETGNPRISSPKLACWNQLIEMMDKMMWNFGLIILWHNKHEHVHFCLHSFTFLTNLTYVYTCLTHVCYTCLPVIYTFSPVGKPVGNIHPFHAIPSIHAPIPTPSLTQSPKQGGTMAVPASSCTTALVVFHHPIWRICAARQNWWVHLPWVFGVNLKKTCLKLPPPRGIPETKSQSTWNRPGP